MTQTQPQTGHSDSPTTPDLGLVQITNPHLEILGPLCRPLLDRVTPLTRGMISTEDVFRLVAEDRYQLWTVVEKHSGNVRCVGVTQINEYPSGMKVCEILLCAGDGMRDWISTLADVEKWARMNGCDRVLVNGRRGWVRMLTGYEEQYTVLSKPLGD